jgi:hypothetical protein
MNMISQVNPRRLSKHIPRTLKDPPITIFSQKNLRKSINLTFA